MNIDPMSSAPVPQAASNPVPVPVAAPAVRIAPSGPAPQPDASAGDPAVVARAAQDATRQLQQNGTQLSIEFDDQLRRAVYKIVDGTTGQVVRQIPSKEIVAIARALSQDTRQGVLFRADA